MSLRALMMVVFLILAACGGGKNNDEELVNTRQNQNKLAGKSLLVLSGEESLQFIDETVQGIGSFLMLPELDAVDSAHHFTFQTIVEPGGSIEFFVNSKSDLTQGVSLFIQRDLLTSALSAYVRVGNAQFNITKYFGSSTEAPLISGEFDLHNDHGTRAHFIGWFSEQVDSALMGRGNGQSWGVKLDKAKVIYFHKEEPRDEH